MCFAHSNTIWCQDKAHLELLVGGLVQDEDGNMVHNSKKNRGSSARGGYV